jgi:hypothetical protein
MRFVFGVRKCLHHKLASMAALRSTESGFKNKSANLNGGPQADGHGAMLLLLGYSLCRWEKGSGKLRH